MAIDKAPWDQAAEQLFRATLAGAKAGEEAYPEMELEELTIDWAAVPVFDRNGKVVQALADTKEPGTTPFTTKARYVRRRDPNLR